MIPLELPHQVVYVRRSRKTGQWYTGYTQNLQKRLSEHQTEARGYTRKRGPYEVMYYEACISEDDARAREKYLKSGMGKRYVRNRLKRFLTLTG